MDERHGGNLRKLEEIAGRPSKDILDFSANINPLGPPEGLRSWISSHVSSVVHYPDPDCSSLRSAIATSYGIKEEEVLLGNGSTEIIYLLPKAVPMKRAIIPVPSFSDYARASELEAMSVEKIFLKEEEGFELDLSLLDSKLITNDLVFLGQPNNPTGLLFDTEGFRDLALRHPSTLFVVDEAFIQFVEGAESLTRNRPSNIIVIYSFTKFYAIPGLRLGGAIADPEIVQRMQGIMPPWSVNTLAQVVGEKVLEDHSYVLRTKAFVREQREFLLKEFQFIPGLTVYPGKANFLLVRIDRKDVNAPTLARKMLDSGIAIRVCDNFDGLDRRFFRVAVRTEEENLRLLHALKKAMGLSLIPARVRQKTPAIMFQGTSSNAGKSVLAAAMCRILLQDGYRVVPFKSQNMSLNSFVTRQGGEMGRAQVLQAQACRLDPDVRMNPILLKPSNNTGCQVIILGHPIGNMNVSEYIEYKPKAFDEVKRAFDSLAREYDVIVMEGAGSPAEINLKHHDIVNMKMADHAGAPVLLIGDIDRGGVFASLIGTWEVMSDWEQKLLAGFIINRFRGDETLLGPAIEYTQNRTGLGFYGVVPYLHNLGLSEEDSVSFKSSDFNGAPLREDHVEIGVIDLPHISNFTDFDPLKIEPDVHLRIVRSTKDLGHPDAIILPGSKNVISDLRYLRQSGLEEKIMDLAVEGRTEVVGICGGFQMLGQRVEDPLGVESHERTIQALGLMPISTIMAQQKTLVYTEGIHLHSGLEVRGYEIHHGQTDGTALIPMIQRKDGEVIGVGAEGGRIWGTYLHGIFDADEFRRWFIDRLRIKHDLPAIGKVCVVYDLDPALERLADVVRRSLKIEEIYKLMGLK
jgi:cobyric acid synthase CobQ/L-threonine-O-3-phosphate decarboxylase